MATRLQVYVVTHRPFPEVALPHAQTLWVGDAGEGRDDSDRTGHSIWQKNPTHCELTALYWIWKNVRPLPEYVGLFHYRRFLALNREVANHPDLRKQSAVLLPVETIRTEKILALGDEDLAAIRSFDVILPRPTPLGMSICEHYAANKDERGWQAMIDALSKVCPSWLDEAVRFEEDSCCLFNVFLARASVFNDYCEWLFPIVEEMERQVAKLDNFDLSRFYGFPAERLTHLYFARRADEGLRILETPLVFLDESNHLAWQALRDDRIREIWIWGAGALGQFFLCGARLMKQAGKVRKFVDEDLEKRSAIIEKLPVVLPSELKKKQNPDRTPFVVVASTAWAEIEEALQDMGFSEGEDFAILRGLT